MSQLPAYGEVPGRPIGEMSRRGFMRRMLGVGVAILSVEFLAGTVNFLWPNVRSGLGGKLTIGSPADIIANDPAWATGTPYAFNRARVFFVNVPAAKGLIDGTGASIADPGVQVAALYRKCPHLGCQVPPLCDQSKWFECLCHGSKYTILGEKRDGPAPRGMDSFRVEVVEGAYVIDTSRIVGGPPIGTVTFDDRDPAAIPHCAG